MVTVSAVETLHWEWSLYFYWSLVYKLTHVKDKDPIMLSQRTYLLFEKSYS